MTNRIISKEYAAFLEQIKTRVATSRYQAALAVNREMLLLYHHIGSEIIRHQKTHGWGAKVIDQLSKDLKTEFPDMKGFSPTNLKYMRLFAESYSLSEMSQQAADQLPWFHLVTILVEVKDPQERQFYINKARQHGWSRNILSMQIETSLYKREGKAISNFQDKLSSPQSDLAQSTLRNPYLFDFLNLGNDAHEREVEKGLINHIERFLLEFGEEFAFVGRQYHLQVEDQDFYLDLLFYHLKLRCFVVMISKPASLSLNMQGK